MILWELFYNFFKIGLFTFGGGYAMIPMITEVVVEKGWLDLHSVVDFIAVSESTPGPFAINIATFVGSHMGGFPGAVLATLGVVLPSFLMILVVAKEDAQRAVEILKKNGEDAWVLGEIASGDGVELC